MRATISPQAADVRSPTPDHGSFRWTSGGEDVPEPLQRATMTSAIIAHASVPSSQRATRWRQSYDLSVVADSSVIG